MTAAVIPFRRERPVRSTVSEQTFVVAIKESARERNEAVDRLVADADPRRRYDSRTAAEAEAAELSADGGDVRLQAVAPQDDVDADAYLVGASRAEPPVPDGDPEDGWRYAVTADQYGALGEALLTAGDGVVTPLEQYVRGDLGLDPDADLAIAVDADPAAVTAPGRPGEWQPDCELTVAVAGHRVARYRCEIKTGDGKLERNQREIAEATASETPVLLARVDVTELPAEYEVSFERLGDADAESPGDPAQKTVDDW